MLLDLIIRPHSAVRFFHKWEHIVIFPDCPEGLHSGRSVLTQRVLRCSTPNPGKAARSVVKVLFTAHEC